MRQFACTPAGIGETGAVDPVARTPERFSERDFYREEFRGRSVGLVLADVAAGSLGAVEEVLAEFADNRTRALLLASDPVLVEKLGGGDAVPYPQAAWVEALWRRLGEGGRASVLVAPEGLAEASRRIALRLRLARLVWLDEQGPLLGDDGERLSFLTAAGLATWMRRHPGDPRAPLVQEIQAMLAGDLAAVSICRPAELSDELFTYTGSGSFFTRRSYTEVRPLALDEFDAASSLIARGVEEGYLVSRPPQEVERILAHAYGVFVGEGHLAGIGALLPHEGHGSGEIASLYTLTRFLGEGVGGQLLRSLRQEAGRRGLRVVFACTTSERVLRFFERHGFRRVDASELPPEKWRSYDPERRARLFCVRCAAR
jgi:N-acetylglutamate synthase-like GNAT family acetyltransferase